METIWVLENIENDITFYNEQMLLMLIASVSLWRKYHPTHYTVFYCDKISYDFLKDLNIFNLWDEVRIIDFKYNNINKKIFWSTAKTIIISETKTPLLLIDHDFLIFKNIDNYLNTVLYSYDEYADNWYPSVYSAIVRNLSKPINKTVNYASNVSLLYLPDINFAKKYAFQTLKNHIEFTALNSPKIHTGYMILSEQLMLKQMLVEENIEHHTLSKNIWDCKKEKFTDEINNIGIWNLEDVNLSYKHYGMEKRRLMNNKKEYDENISFLYRCINAGNFIDIITLKNKINIKFKTL